MGGVPSNQTLILDLWWLSVILQFTVCLRLVASGLWRSYPRFVGYLGALAIESCVLISLTHPGKLYRRAWVVTRVVLLALELLAVLEIFNRWSASYPGIGRFGRRLLLVLLALATGLSVSTLPIAWSSKGWIVATYIISIANRAVQAGLAAFLIFMLVFFLKFGGPVAANLRRHTWAMTVFITANTLGYFVITARAYELGNTLLQAVVVGSLIYWLFALRISGDKAPVAPVDGPGRWEAAEEMNRQLMDFASSVKQSRRAVGKK